MTEVQVDRRRDLAHLVLGFDLIQACVGLDDVIEFEDNEKLVRPDALHFEICPVIFLEFRFTAEPRYLRFRCTDQLTLEDQPVPVVLLPKLGLLGEAGCEIIGDPHVYGAPVFLLTTRCYAKGYTLFAFELNPACSSLPPPPLIPPLLLLFSIWDLFYPRATRIPTCGTTIQPFPLSHPFQDSRVSKSRKEYFLLFLYS